jgi:hypothetical protein
MTTNNEVTISNKLGDWEKFTIETHGERFGLKSAHDTYIGVNQFKAVLCKEKCLEWETYIILLDNVNDKLYYVFQSIHNTHLCNTDKYVGASSSIDDNERYEVIFHDE